MFVFGKEVFWKLAPSKVFQTHFCRASVPEYCSHELHGVCSFFAETLLEIQRYRTLPFLYTDVLLNYLDRIVLCCKSKPNLIFQEKTSNYHPPRYARDMDNSYQCLSRKFYKRCPYV